MALLKFMTVFDDDYGQILNHKKLYAYDLSAYPTVYFANGRPYYDSINSNTLMYCKFKERGQLDSVKPTIPCKVFEAEFERAYNNGYIGVVVICPNAKWTDYYRIAKNAAKLFYKKVDVDEMGFRISVIDSRTFAAGTLFLAVTFANMFTTLHQSTNDFLDYIELHNQYNYTYILSFGPTVFGETDGFAAYKVLSKKLIKLDICKYPENIMFDNFAELVCDTMKSTNRNYYVAMGNSCKFAPNILGRIERISGKNPSCAIQYAVATTSILGSDAICISLV